MFLVGMVHNWAVEYNMATVFKVLFVYNWDRESCPLYRVVECPLFKGYLSIEVNGKTVGIFRNVHYIMGIRCLGVSVKWGFHCMHIAF